MTLDDGFANDEVVDSATLIERLPLANVWAQELANLPPENTEATFRSFPDGDLDNLSFLIGLCRYPGLFWKRKESGAIFGPMLEHVKENPYESEPRFVLMVGDQISAENVDGRAKNGT